ncbi:16S rRNA (guanine(966)-N(2))-methyltransferase RsmD [Saccharibacillus alkalitolerans]|uniref:16S rRNA (Guanine(966)-N(2))-methyltransferase RsmD n=1 Tax=Saccharibacillus alkalitolerans TaxID=2705290 RepID=A0ABX0F6K3_9BACL|nr:16S rRNA (guanine(966)-N(2))-methyltransferase RsmD [Saccharibacillus alkalitolerans]NGZ75555.1 16S rRNA (guanine(966)-N(2))-methyltransferase RsmD [Saccharibacillus alkalitolerans]
MRVVAGEAKGRPLKAVPGSGTRPTTDKVKEAIFSMIGPFFEGGTALDLFAGTGGLAIEALSRGMERAVFVDADAKSIEVVKSNLKATGFEGKAEVYRNDAQRALKALAKRETKLDLVFLDPPYRMKNGAELMLKMEEAGLLEAGAVVVLEYESSYEYPESFGAFALRRKAVYGETAVSIYDWTPKDREESQPAEEDLEP